LKKNNQISLLKKYCDFHLILFIAKAVDIHTALNITESINQEKEVSQDLDNFIK